MTTYKDVDAFLPADLDDLISLGREVRRLLFAMPEEWTAVDHDDRSSYEERAICLLHAAGLIDQRIRVELSNERKSVVLTLAWHGELLAVEDGQRLVFDIESGLDGPPTESRLVSTDWRISHHGIKARQDLPGGNTYAEGNVYEWVFKIGRHKKRPRTAGELTERRVEPPSPSSQATTLDIGNWPAGAEAFARAIASLGVDTTEQDKGMSDLKNDILTVLRENNATSQHKRMSGEEIAEKVGVAADAGNFKNALPSLVSEGLLNSKTGRGGGYWLRNGA